MTSQMCSIGFRSKERAGQSIASMPYPQFTQEGPIYTGHILQAEGLAQWPECFFCYKITVQSRQFYVALNKTTGKQNSFARLNFLSKYRCVGKKKKKIANQTCGTVVHMHFVHHNFIFQTSALLFLTASQSTQKNKIQHYNENQLDSLCFLHYLLPV